MQKFEKAVKSKAKKVVKFEEEFAGSKRNENNFTQSITSNEIN